MKKTFLFLMTVSLILTVTTPSYAALFFKMTADNTTLNVGQIAKIELFAYSEEAADMNGLNSWQLSMLVSGDGVVEVDESSIVLFAPFAADYLFTGMNSPTGQINNLSMNSMTTPVNSDLGVGGYHKIAEFQIQAVSTGQVDYSIGDASLGFFGTLRDYPAPGNYFDGTFDMAASDNHFSIVPEPATIVLLGGGFCFFMMKSRKSGRS